MHGSCILQDGTHLFTHCTIPEAHILETDVPWLVKLHLGLQTSSFHSQLRELNSGPETSSYGKEVIKALYADLLIK